jgi:hypothetical protein
MRIPTDEEYLLLQMSRQFIEPEAFSDWPAVRNIVQTGFIGTLY